jgi:hypothetical protein
MMQSAAIVLPGGRRTTGMAIIEEARNDERVGAQSDTLSSL